MAEITAALQLSPAEAQRIGSLLERGGTLALELERLDSIGIFPLTRVDAEYPPRYRDRLKDSAPPVLFCAGDHRLTKQPGIAVVGSRNLGPAGEDIARKLGEACAASGVILVSGGARGTDAIGMKAALESGGRVVGVLADSLTKSIRQPMSREAIESGMLCFITAYHPDAPFSVGNAMGRNQLIYALAEHAVVVSSDEGKGGTWEGATQAMRKDLAPVHVVAYEGMPPGNKELIRRGAKSLPVPLTYDPSELKDHLDAEVSGVEPVSLSPPSPVQQALPGMIDLPAAPRRKKGSKTT